ncbi:hypothetical protein NDU88_000231 [Pleurodeles waltl]|uniref:Methyltransferase type 11 domain-containing protein n=1 Tax=Pleurodeles waltl TaxID=8319 RepID=A0AAV7V4P6_PLEWA|nr:hypothetical protein NDU88_000231 [Pleurodeles waltl]
MTPGRIPWVPPGASPAAVAETPGPLCCGRWGWPRWGRCVAGAAGRPATPRLEGLKAGTKEGGERERQRGAVSSDLQSEQLLPRWGPRRVRPSPAPLGRAPRVPGSGPGARARGQYPDPCAAVDSARLTAAFKGQAAQHIELGLAAEKKGDVKGDSLIGLSYGPHIYYTLPACEYFNEITFACADDKSIQETQKWLKNEPDAMDWSQIIKMICELQGSGETWIEKQHMLQRKVKRVLEHDVMSSNPFSPITHPKADCLLLAHCIEHFVTDKKSYCDALKNVSSLLKSGGHLIMSAVLGATFYMCGDVKFPVLCMEEAFLKDALRGAGYVIQEDHMYLRKTESLYDMTDYKYGIILKACKEREM